MALNSSTAARTLATLGLSLKPRVSANSAALAASIWRCRSSQVSYWAWRVRVKRPSVFERKKFVKALPVRNFAWTWPSAKVTL